MTLVQSLAGFVEGARFADMSAAAAEQLKIHVLDTIGVAIGALDAAPIQAIRRLMDELGGRPLDPHRRRQNRSRPRGLLQRRAQPISRFHGQLSRRGRDLSPL